jgi:hypothetical protein
MYFGCIYLMVLTNGLSVDEFFEVVKTAVVDKLANSLKGH